MRSWLYIILVFFVLSTIKTKVVSQDIIRRWYHYDFLDNFIILDSLGYFNLYNSKAGYLFPEKELIYEINSSEPNSFYKVKIGSLFKAHVHYFGKYIVFITYKSGLFSDHIDEVGLFLKNETYKDSLDFTLDPKLEILIPEHFKGKAYVAFSQPVNNEHKNITTPEKTTIRINEDGLLRTSIMQNPLAYARKNEIFRYEASNKLLPVFHPGFTRINNSKLEIDSAEVCVLSLGFNQNPRSLINEKFGQEIEGDVGQYIIDTFENLVKFDKIK